MKWWAAATAVFVTLTVGTFFFAPVVFWYSERGGPVQPGAGEHYSPVFRSLGCAYVGYGDVYAPGLGGVKIGCSGPPVTLLEGQS